MADNTRLNPGVGGDNIRSDEIGGIKFPTSKITLGDDNADGGFVSTGNPMPIVVPTLPLLVSGPTLTWAAPTFVTILSTSLVALAANASRRGAILVNDSSQDIFLSLRTGAPAVVGSGFRINAGGGSYEITNENLTLDSIQAIAASGSNNLTIHEAT